MTEPCRFCGSRLIKRHGSRWGKRLEQYQCSNLKCRKYQSFPPRHPVSAKVLLLDIETLYMEVRGVWSLETRYIQPDRVVKDWSIVCWGAKWLFEPEIMGQVVTPKEAINRTEESILEGMWKLMDEADVIITQNGNEFDLKRLNTKFITYGYPPPSPYKSVDTLKVARETFAFTSNKLDELGKKLLGLEGKIKMSMPDWDACAEGSQDALDKMLYYCRNDVAPLLEDLYLKFRPWIKGHPNMNLYSDHSGDVCPKCESQSLKWNHSYFTPQGEFKGFRCQACGATGRGTTKEHKEKSVQIVPT